MRIVILVAALLSQPAMAAHGDATYHCKIAGFDAKNVSLNCDPKDAKAVMQTPREWLGKDEAVKPGAAIALTLNADQEKKWLELNPKVAAAHSQNKGTKK